MTTWNDEKKEELKRRWEVYKESLNEIARNMRVTRSTISGAISRFGLKKRGRIVATRKPRTRTKKEKANAAAPRSNLGGMRLTQAKAAVQFTKPVMMTKGEMREMLRQAVVNTKKMEEES